MDDRVDCNGTCNGNAATSNSRSFLRPAFKTSKVLVSLPASQSKSSLSSTMPSEAFPTTVIFRSSRLKTSSPASASIKPQPPSFEPKQASSKTIPRSPSLANGPSRSPPPSSPGPSPSSRTFSSPPAPSFKPSTSPTHQTATPSDQPTFSLKKSFREALIASTKPPPPPACSFSSRSSLNLSDSSDVPSETSRTNPPASMGSALKAELLSQWPSATLSFEKPSDTNGGVFQVRTIISGEVFIGRSRDEAEAEFKCCQKAVRFIQQYFDQNANCVMPLYERRKEAVTKRTKADEDQPHETIFDMSTSEATIPKKEQIEEKNPPVYEGHKRQQKKTTFEHSLKDKARGQRPDGKRKKKKKSAEEEGSCSEVAAVHEADAEAGDQTAYSKAKSQKRSRKKVPERKAKDSCWEEFDEDGLPLKLTMPMKNAVMMLNELFPPPKAPQYKVTSQTGPPNNPTFSMVCTVGKRSFSAQGSSKKEAKLACSQAAIEAIYGCPVEETRSVPERSNPRASRDLDDWMELEGKNPVSILNELYPGIQYQLVSTTGPSHAPQFLFRASLNEMSFEGTGNSKKCAKLNASKALLVHLHRVGFDPMTGDMMRQQVDRDEGKVAAEAHSFADIIGSLVSNKFQYLFGSTTYAKRKVMSGIVMTRNLDAASGEVICVSSGTKCINGEQLSLEGCVVNDTHSEIVSKRCLQRFLFQHLELLAKGGKEAEAESVFRRCRDVDLYELKDGVEFHLFVTTAPCGDARIFSLHESSSSSSLASESSRERDKVDCYRPESSRGLLRSKIECGMGTVPISAKITVQTFDGVMSGDRLLTMACSDKILRWNVVGVQGALLSLLIKPVYLKSITVGSKFHPGHMKRAMYERIESNIHDLPKNYILNCPQLHATTSPETRQAAKAHDYSVNWITGQGQPEILNPSTGKTINDNISRLSKKILFGKFLEVSRQLRREISSPAYYCEVKQLASDYQMAKARFVEALSASGCGRWIEKPVEEDQFVLAF